MVTWQLCCLPWQSTLPLVFPLTYPDAFNGFARDSSSPRHHTRGPWVLSAIYGTQVSYRSLLACHWTIPAVVWRLLLAISALRTRKTSNENDKRYTDFRKWFQCKRGWLLRATPAIENGFRFYIRMRSAVISWIELALAWTRSRW